MMWADDFKCKECTERHTGCHEKCPSYLEAKQVCIKRSVAYRKDRGEYNNYKADKINKVSKRRKRHGSV